MVYESELYHHGILGQKWGKRNGPPYPLGSSNHSAAEKKAGSKNGYKGWRDSNNWVSVRNKKEYGLSKRQVKSKVSKAKSDYRKNVQEDHSYFSGVTGPSWQKVKDEHQKTWNNDTQAKEIMSKINSAYKKASKAYDDGNIKLCEKYQNQGDRLFSKDYTDRVYEVAKQYANDYQEALLKDIGYNDVEKGKKMLDEYGIYNAPGMALAVRFYGKTMDEHLRKMGYNVKHR